MTEALDAKLHELRGLPAELEWFDFKEAKGGFDPEKLGEYFSALSNEANLKGQPCGWLIFGVEDKPPRKIVGTLYKTDRAALDVMKKHVADQTSQRLTFTEIHELHTSEGRVLMFEIPPAPPGVPVAWKGHFYGRDGQSVGALNPEEYERIRAQAARRDWSAEVVDAATFGDLDPAAIAFARAEFLKKQPQHAHEATGWDDLTFLNKAKVTLSGKTTRAALVLLGTPESVLRLLQPAVVEVSWRLNDPSGEMRDYEHIGPPLILAGQALLKKIRNLKVRHMPGGSLFPEEVTQYDEQVLREALHNCIAHQDYTASARITVVENDDELAFANRGSFIPGSVEHVIEADAPPDVYRNRFLAQAMVNLNMIDTMGSGIRRMFNVQRKRSFPLPDYDLSDRQRVVVRITGRIIDEKYTRLLLKSTDLALADAIALDKVQKKKEVDRDLLADLKRRGLVEGRIPNVFVAAKVAAATDAKADHIRNRAFDKDYYKELIVSYLDEYTEGSYVEFKKLLVPKLSDALDAAQKEKFVSNLLQEMRRDGVIEPHGPRSKARWAFAKAKASGHDPSQGGGGGQP
ncbi:MAG TPA: RNA-binding domain-containing protein [Thermoleophilia bacterium]|nr:RNA-binding domain-containing protein [Thermoleophilia bacterium]